MKASSRSLLLLGIVATLGVGVVTTVYAHKGATGVVKQRMGAMKDMAKGTKTLALMVTGKKPYDAGAVEDVAASLKQHSEEIPKLFPKGSNKHPSEATANIWTDWDNFKQYAASLGKLAGELDAAAPQGKGGVTAVFARIGKACSGCHEDFRKKKK